MRHQSDLTKRIKKKLGPEFQHVWETSGPHSAAAMPTSNMTPTQQKIWEALPKDGRPISTNSLIDLVWTDNPEGHGNPNNLRAQICKLRAHLAAEGSEFAVQSKLGPGSPGYRRVRRK